MNSIATSHKQKHTIPVCQKELKDSNAGIRSGKIGEADLANWARITLIMGNRIHQKLRRNYAFCTLMRGAQLGRVITLAVQGIIMNKRKVNLARLGEKNGMWKGEHILYGSLHDWVGYHKGKATYCLFARTTYNICSKRFEWASISHQAKRDLTDYIPLCARHHRIYDGNMPKNKSKDPAVHRWVKKRLPKPEYCIRCRVKKAVDLSNTGHTYTRNLQDWEWLCKKCHVKKDGGSWKPRKKNKDEAKAI